MKAWHELVHEIVKEHNGVMEVRLFFGHDGHNSCAFRSYEKELAKGESGRSMQEAVERCLEALNLECSIQKVADQILDGAIAWRDGRDHLKKTQIVSIIRNGLFSAI